MNWKTIAANVSSFVQAAEPVIAAAVTIAAPEAAAGVAIGEKIIQGMLAAEPTAMALYNQISGGTPATPEQLQQFEADYEDAYQQTKADIATALKTAT